jgi:hypothetical protein
VKDLVSSLASEYNKAEEMDKAGAKA